MTSWLGIVADSVVAGAAQHTETGGAAVIVHLGDVGAGRAGHTANDFNTLEGVLWLTHAM